MCIQNRMYSLLMKIVILVLSALAVFSALTMAGGGYSRINFLYYTTLAAIMTFIYYAVAVVTIALSLRKHGARGHKTAGPHYRGGATMILLLGMLLYNAIVPGTPFASGSPLPAALIHIVLPILVLLDWLLFDYKGRYRFVDPLWWLVFPYTYYLLTLLFAQYGALYQGDSLYPYALINPDINGWANVLANMVILTVLYLVFGYIYFTIDRILGYLQKRKDRRLAEERAYLMEREGPVVENVPLPAGGLAGGDIPPPAPRVAAENAVLAAGVTAASSAVLAREDTLPEEVDVPPVVEDDDDWDDDDEVVAVPVREGSYVYRAGQTNFNSSKKTYSSHARTDQDAPRGN